MLALRPLLVRFVSLALAVTVSTGLAAHAPQAFRAWVDTAADVAPAKRVAARPTTRTRAATRPRPAQRSAWLAHLARILGPLAPAGGLSPGLAGVLEPPSSATSASSSWPLARAGRDLLVLKRARLI